MKNIVIADGHPVVRRGLKSILSEACGYLILGEVDSFLALPAALVAIQADILILELSMTGGSGLEVLKETKQKYLHIDVLILSHHAEEHFGLRAFKAGASGYLSKHCHPEQILGALNIISSGKRYFGSVTENFIFCELSKNGSPSQLRHIMLSDREFHVFIRIGEGKTLTSISKDLSLSVKTISTYRQRILKKMNKTTNNEIISYCNRHGLVHSPT